jgi:hypothetical protein
MGRLGCMIALLALPLCPASADTVLPGLVQENLLLPITLPDGSQVKLEATVIRPDRPERFPLVLLVHGTPRAIGETFRTAIAQQSPADFLGPLVAFALRPDDRFESLGKDELRFGSKAAEMDCPRHVRFSPAGSTGRRLCPWREGVFGRGV